MLVLAFFPIGALPKPPVFTGFEGFHKEFAHLFSVY